MSNHDASRKMWGGRFAEPPDPELLAFTSSFAIDRRLLHWDVIASIAHAQMLGATGIVRAEDAQIIVGGLREILRDVAAGQLVPAGSFEDVHSFLEATLYKCVGPTAGRLHTARSRNDQVITAFRLYIKERTIELVELIRGLMDATIERATASLDVLMPGFTHLQHAQPIRLAHHLLAYVWMLDRDARRCMACYRRADVLPLGSGALAGVNFPIDRRQVATALGFLGISENSIDATGDRDFVAEAVFAASLLMVHLSRWAGEIATWATEEFGFIQLSDAVATGSSIMPQKKNPEAAELVRGKTGRVLGGLAALLAMLKGLPAGYNSDLQEDKAIAFDALDTAAASLRAMKRLLDGIEFVSHRMAAASRTGHLTATEAADYLVRKGLPFREAHELAGQVVLTALARGVQLWELPYEVFRTISPHFDEDVREAVTVEASVEGKRIPGGTARQPVEEQLVAARAAVQTIAQWLDEASRALATASRLAQG